MAEVVSLYISSDGCRGIKARVSSSGMVVTEAYSARLPSIEDREFSPDTLRRDLSTFLSDRNLTGLPVLVAFSSRLGYLRHMKLPFTDEDKIRSTAPFELEQYIQAIPIEEAEVDLQILGLTDNGSHLLAAAVEDRVLENLVSGVSGGGFECVSLQMDVVSCFNILKMQGVFQSQKTAWVGYLHGTGASLVLIENGVPVELRDFKIMPGVSGEKESSEEEEETVEEGKEDTNGGDTEKEGTDEDANDMDPPSVDPSLIRQKMKSEMEKTLIATGLAGNVDHLFLFGSPGRDVSLREVREELSADFEVYDAGRLKQVIASGDRDEEPANEEPAEEEPADAETDPEQEETEGGGGDSAEEEEDQKEPEDHRERARQEASEKMEETLNESMEQSEEGETSGMDGFPEHFTVDWQCEEDLLEYIVPVGAAPAGTVTLPCNIEFRKGEYAHRTFWETIRSSAAAFCFTLLLLAGAFLYTQLEERERRYQELNQLIQQQEEQFVAAFPDEEIQDPSNMPGQLQDLLNRAEESIGRGLPVRESALQKWNRIFEQIDARGPIYLTRMELNIGVDRGEASFEIQGRTENRSLMTALRNQIGDIEGVTRGTESVSSRGEIIEFTIPYSLEGEGE